ncbi:MAG TPA: AI-2E family transporter [Candidatus Saccharimonadales bacterium]|nr:AI-2E family transporter [Candidatus Saccharimonadales bacterium]
MAVDHDLGGFRSVLVCLVPDCLAFGVAKNRLTLISYLIIAAMLILTGWLHMGTLLITILFSFFALSKMEHAGKKWVSIALFLIMVTLIIYGFTFFVRQAVKALPMLVDKSVPAMVQFANNHNIELPFSDAESLKSTLMEVAREELHMMGNFAKHTGRELVLLIIGFVVAVSLFLNSQIDLDSHSHRNQNNCYSVLCEEIRLRFHSFYRSFDLVLGAQLIISLINTSLTSVFVIIVGMPYAWMIVVATFLCGLLPIVGNLISNSIIVGVGFTVSPKLAIASLIFLIVVHKLEYFLNSKIIGTRIKNPVWMTLLGVVLGERLMGIPGMILAPVVLHFLKTETSHIPVTGPTGEAKEVPLLDKTQFPPPPES